MASTVNPDLGKLGDCMNTAGFPQSFKADPDGAMRSCTGKANPNIPQAIKSALEACSADELECMARVGKAFRDAGADPLDAIRMV